MSRAIERIPCVCFSGVNAIPPSGLSYTTPAYRVIHNNPIRQGPFANFAHISHKRPVFALSASPTRHSAARRGLLYTMPCAMPCTVAQPCERIPHSDILPGVFNPPYPHPLSDGLGGHQTRRVATNDQPHRRYIKNAPEAAGGHHTRKMHQCHHTPKRTHKHPTHKR